MGNKYWMIFCIIQMGVTTAEIGPCQKKTSGRRKAEIQGPPQATPGRGQPDVPGQAEPAGCAPERGQVNI